MDTIVEIDLNVNVICSSISNDGSEFRIISSTGDPIVVKKADYNCDYNGETRHIVLTLATPLFKNSLYEVSIKNGTDGNTIVNKCGFKLDQNRLFNIEVLDCIPLNFTIDNVSVIKDQKIKLDWSIILSNAELNAFKAFRIYRKENGSTWNLLHIESDPYARSYLDQSLSIQDVDENIYHYKINIIEENGLLATAEERNTILLKSTDDRCNSLRLNWNTYRSRSDGFIVDVGSFATGNLTWTSIDNNFYPDVSTMDSTLLVKLPFSDYGKFKLRVRAPEDGTNFVSESNWIECKCYAKSEQDIEKLQVPNVFTPNNDGLNDEFEIPGIDFFPKNNFQVFNRWGTEVFQLENYNNSKAWNGKGYDGDDLTDGVYLYILTLYPDLGPVVQKTGSITILRTK